MVFNNRHRDASEGSPVTNDLTAPPRLDTGKLLVAPEDPMAAPRASHILTAMDSAGLLDKQRPLGPARFAAGERLFELIAFTGCAVQFGSTASEAPELSIAIEGPYGHPRLRCGRNSRAPCCPTCQRPFSDWRAHCIDGPPVAHSQGLALSCPRCGSQSPVQEWSWGRHAGVGRIFITIEPVFPGEGRPLPALLSILGHAARLGKASSPRPWRYFYVQGEYSPAPMTSS